MYTVKQRACDLSGSRGTFVEHERTVVAIMSHMKFNDVVVLVKKPSARKVLFSNWAVIAEDSSEVCHCCSPYTYCVIG
jgi:hypothetical protein